VTWLPWAALGVLEAVFLTVFAWLCLTAKTEEELWPPAPGRARSRSGAMGTPTRPGPAPGTFNWDRHEQELRNL